MKRRTTDEKRLAVILAAYEREKKAIIFEDGVEADAAESNMSRAECYMAGRDYVLNVWAAAMAASRGRLKK